MSLIIEMLVQIGLLVGGWKLYRWSKSKQHADTTKWRRRIAALLFVSPMVLWLMESILPSGLQSLVDALSWLNTSLDNVLKWIVDGATGELEGTKLDGVWMLAFKPVVYSLAYGLLGAIIGWPFDRRAKRKAAEASAEAEAEVEA